MAAVTALAAAFLFFGVPITIAEYTDPPRPLFPVAQDRYSTSTAELIIRFEAARAGANADSLVATLRCESKFNPDAAGDFSTTTNEYTSFGIAQIHLPAHLDITKEQALNPNWSIRWAAAQFAAGNQWMWSCYRSLVAQKPAIVAGESHPPATDVATSTAEVGL